MKATTTGGLYILGWLVAVTFWGASTLAQEKSPQEKPPAEWDTTKARGQTRDIDFDTSEGTPIILYRQDLSRLGWALGENVRQTLLANNTTP